MKSVIVGIFLSLGFIAVPFQGMTVHADELWDEGTSTQEDFSVKTYRVKTGKREIKPIKLIEPKGNSKYGPGVVTFSWKLSSAVKKKKVKVVVEDIDSGKTTSRLSESDKLRLNMKAGKYRWKVALNNKETSWRSFEIFSVSPKDSPPELTVDNPDSTIDESYLAYRPPEERRPVADEKPQDSIRKKANAEQLANNLKNQLKELINEQAKTTKALQKERKRIEAERLAKLNAERLARERIARAEAKRQAELEKAAKQRAKQLKDIQVAKLKAEKAVKKLLASIQVEKNARIEAEQATKELAVKIEVARQTAVKEDQEDDSGQELEDANASTENPSRWTDLESPSNSSASLPPASKESKRTPVERAPAAKSKIIRREGDEDLNWSGEGK